MKLKFGLATFLLAVIGASVAVGPADATATESATPTAYPPTSTETANGKFIVKCGFSHRKRVDPIVMPGPNGTRSAHVHDFFGNRSTDSDSTLDSMLTGATTCRLNTDTAGYWVPTLIRPSGKRQNPVTAFSYYRNKPVEYGTTAPYPPDFRMIAGGVGAYPEHTFWNCFKDDSSRVRYRRPHFCADDYLVGNVFFPNCWDGVHTDSADHRSHVVYPTASGSTACPQTHPIKLPNLRFFVRYPKNTGGRGWRLSDGTTKLHADFWNTWQQPGLEKLVRDCLNAGVQCGKQTG